MYFKTNIDALAKAIYKYVPANEKEMFKAAEAIRDNSVAKNIHMLTTVQVVALGLAINTRGTNMQIAQVIKALAPEKKTHGGTVAWYRCAYNAGRIRLTKLKPRKKDL